MSAAIACDDGRRFHRRPARRMRDLAERKALVKARRMPKGSPKLRRADRLFATSP